MAQQMTLTDEQVRALEGAAPAALSDEDVARLENGREQPEALTDEDVARLETGQEQPETLTDEDVTRMDPAGQEAPRGVIGTAADIGRDLLTQPVAGVVRDLPRMLWQTAQAHLPGESPSPANPMGSGLAGFAGTTVQEIDAREREAAWDDPKAQGWAAVPGMAMRSLAPNLLAAVATQGASVAAMPYVYGMSRAQEVFDRQRDRALLKGETFDEGKARMNAAAAGMLEGGLEYVASWIGMGKPLKAVGKNLAKTLGKTAVSKLAKGVATGLRELAKEMLAEAVTEGVQEGGGNLHEQLLGIAENVEKDPQALWGVNWQAVWDAAKYAAAAGSLSAGMADRIRAVQQHVQETRDARRAKEDAEWLREQREAGREVLPAAEVENHGEDGLAEQSEELEDAEGVRGGEEQQAADDGAGGAETTGAQNEALLDVQVQPAAVEAAGERVATPVLSDEQVAAAEQQAEENAKKDYGAKKKTVGRSASDELWQNDPVRAAVIELGGIRADGTEDQSAIPLQFRAEKGKGQSVDQVLIELASMPQVGERVSAWTANDLIEHLQGNARERSARFSERAISPEEREWLKRAQTVGPNNLALGFTFSVKGVPYRVTDIDAAGLVIERTDGKDKGWAVRLDEGRLMNIDGGTLKNAAGRQVRLRQEKAPEAPTMRAPDYEDVPLDELAAADEMAQAEDMTATDEDVPFRTNDQTPANDVPAQAAPQTQAAPTTKPVRQVRFVRRGYDAEREAADDPLYSRWGGHPLDLPELVELAQDLTGGKVPRVVGKVNQKGTAAGAVVFGSQQNAAGQPVFGRPEVITLLASNYRLISQDEELEMRDAARQQAEQMAAGDEARAKELEDSLFDQAYMAELEARVNNGPRFAMAVLAHEIGHIADQAARYGLVKPDRKQPGQGLNLLGRVAGLLSWTRDIMADDPSGKTLSAEEVRRLQGIARKNAQPGLRGKQLMQAVREAWATVPELRDVPGRPELATIANATVLRDAMAYMADTRPVLSEWLANATWQEQVRSCAEALNAIATNKMTAQQRRMGATWFRQAFVNELEARRQAHLAKMTSELEALIAWWNGGDRSLMDAYYNRSSEMFAEAFGVYLNNPRAVQKRAPMFYRTLMNYMESRPEVADRLEALNAMMARGQESLMEHRLDGLMDMYGKERRAHARARETMAKRGRTARLAADGARYHISRKSGPLWALIKTADALGLSDLADRTALWSDKVENVSGAEKLWNTSMYQIGEILDQGDIDVQKFDVWAFLNMVARNPAYKERANPKGWHAQSAAEMLDYLRTKWGDAQTNTLDRAVNRFQELWQSQIVPLMQGMYDEKTMKMVRENPVYFTLMVGMDDAEINAFQKAVAEMNEDQLLAFVQRSMNKSPFGDAAGTPIIARRGTHRPSMSLLGATMLKGTRIISDTYRNALAVQTRDLLAAVKDPYYQHQEGDEGMMDTESQTVVRYMENGVRMAYYAPKYVGHFVRGDNPMQAANRLLSAIRTYTLTNVWKRAQTIWSAAFSITQPISDAKTWRTLMPGVRTPIGNIARGNVIGGLAQMLPAATWYLPPGLFPPQSRERLMRPMRELVRQWQKTGVMDPRLKQLVDRGMSDLGGAFQGISRADPDAGDLLQVFAGVTAPKALQVYAQDLNWAQRQWERAKAIPALGRIFELSGRAFEAMQNGVEVEALANKLAGMEYLDDKYPGMPERQKRQAVLEFAGNPNFAARAGADTFIDTAVQTFYNPWKEGVRGVIDAFKADPRGMMARMMWYNVMPTMLMWAASNGLLEQMIAAMIPASGEPEDDEDRERFLASVREWSGWMRRMPTYYNKRYVNIPLSPVGTDAVFAITIPQAQSLAPFNGLLSVALDELSQATGSQPQDRQGIQRGVSAVTSEIGVLNAFTSGNRSAIGQVFGPLLEAAITDRSNYFDTFYQRELLDRNEEALMRGGRWTFQALPAWKKYGKNAWNNSLGQMVGRFDTKTPRADQALKTDLQKFLNAPLVGPMVGRLFRVVGGGEYEKMQRQFSPGIQDRAYSSILAQQAALEMIKDPQRRFPAWAAEKYANDPEFRSDYNAWVTEHMAYSGMTPTDKAILGKRNPKWQREMLLQDRLMREER